MDPTRRAEILEAAFELFLRFGYRKTSMDEVARAAGLSRQGLYLSFDGKPALFVAVVEHYLASLDAAVGAALEQRISLHERVLGAFDAFVGATISLRQRASAVDELLEATADLVGPQVQAFEQRFLARMEEALSAHRPGDASPSELAHVLGAASVGIKQSAADRDAYRQRMGVVVKVVLGAG